MNKKNILTLLSLVALVTVGGFSSNKETTVLAKEMPAFHNVVKGENLYRISLNEGFSVDEVAVFNNLDKNAIIKPSDKIYFPEKSTTEKETNVESTKLPTGKVAKTVDTSPERVYGKNLLDWQYNILCAVVQQESVGLTSPDQLKPDAYISALAVMSSITNRVDADSYYGSDVYGVISKPHQYEAFGAKHYEQQLGNILDVTRQAVNDGLNGKKSHNYLNFRSQSYATAYGYGGVNLGGNVYFND